MNLPKQETIVDPAKSIDQNSIKEKLGNMEIMSSDDSIEKQRKRKLSNDINTDTTNNKDGQQMDTSTENGDIIIPKKRGRGRAKKNCTESTIKQEDTPDKPEVVTFSKRGRTVKKINYLLMENTDPTDENVISELDKEPTEATPKRRGRGRARKSLAKIEDAAKMEKETVSSTNSNIKDEPEPLDSKIDNNNESKSPHEAESNEDSGQTNKKGQNRYNWTGNVTKTLNHLFNAIQGKEGTETEKVETPPVKRKGRPKKYLTEHDSSAKITCMNCNQMMPLGEWPTHNSTEHYNLAWKQGELPFPTTDEALVLKTLNKLKKSKNTLKCNKCNVKINKARLFYEHLEVCNGIVNTSGEVTCAVCKTTMDKTAWIYHKYRHHNNLAWREGDPPLDLGDQELVMRILTTLYKSKKPLHCEKCDIMKKSVFGYLSHKSICQKSADELEELKVACDICGRRMLPVSMDCHLKIHNKPEASAESISGSSFFDTNMENSCKRKAARHALEVISNIKGELNEEMKYYTDTCEFKEPFVHKYFQNQFAESSTASCIFSECEFSVDSIESILEHLSSCDKKPSEYYLCKLCLFISNTEPEILTHLKKQHNKALRVDLAFKVDMEQTYSEDEVLDMEDRERKMLRLRYKHKILSNPTAKVKPLFLIYPMREEPTRFLYQQAYVWMKEFCDDNYNNTNLHQLLRNRTPGKIVDADLLTEYLPKSHLSCDVAAKILKSDDKDAQCENWDWQKMELFEVKEFHEGDTTIFCGGPITSLAWLPTPHKLEKCDQILAISVLNNRDVKYRIDTNYSEPCLIQFWNFGALNERDPVTPFLMSCIALNGGPIWHMEWCPSGCFDEEPDGSRMGLLAVACSNSFVYIYSVDRIPEHDRGLIYKTNPVIRLQFCADTDNIEKQYACKISWSKAPGHRYIAVGYSTGFVGIFDLNADSQLLKKQTSDIEVTLFPYLTFQAHYSNITAISLNHLSGGNRWLCTGSFDRTVTYWDLYKNFKISTARKSVVTDGYWMTLWPSVVISEDETTMTNTILTHTYYKPLREAMTETGNLTFAVSGIKSLSFSDWLNAVLHCSAAGEIMAQFNHRLIYNISTKGAKAGYTKCLFSRTKLVPKIEGASKEYKTSKEAEAEFGLVFMDYQLDRVDSFPNTRKKNAAKREEKNEIEYFAFSSSMINGYGLESINKVQLNPNLQSYKYYVAGYHSGFVRLKHMKFLSFLKW